MIRIRPVAKPADFPVIAQVLTAVDPEWPVTAEMVARWDEQRNPKRHSADFVAEHGEAGVVAVAGVGEDDFAWEEGKYWLNVRVHPDFRRRGIGGALYEHLMSHLQAQAPVAARKVLCMFGEDRPETRTFVERRGFVLEWKRYESRLRTEGFDFSPYAPIEARVREEGLEIKSLAKLMEVDPGAARKLWELDWILIQDVPMGVAFTKREFEQWMKEELDDPHFVKEASFVALDPRRHDPLTGSFVGYTSLMNNLGGFWVIGMTGVLREYRGRGLAKALKLRGMRYVQANGGGEIRTFNDPPNFAMYGMNLAIGFRPYPSRLRYMKRLDGQPVEPFDEGKYRRLLSTP
jgi:mycothiol synthase